MHDGLDVYPVANQHDHHERRHANRVHKHASRGVTHPPFSCAAVVARQRQLLGEIVAIVKGCAEGMGLKAVAHEMGRTLHVQLNTDSSAARGAALRTGAGRLKHVQTNQFWIQERLSRGDATIRKVPREQNVSDLFTHHWSNKEGRLHLPRMGFVTPEPGTSPWV